MKCIVFLVLLLSIGSVMAQDDSKHMVTFGRNGLGWNGGYEEMATKSDSPFKATNFALNNIAINYAYRLGQRWQLGGFYQTIHEEYEFKKDAGGDSFIKEDVTVYGLFGLYNFSDDFHSSYFLGASLSYFIMEEELDHGLADEEGKAPFELDDTGSTYELILGKRFSFEKWGIKNLTYAPTVSVYYRNHGRDFDDQGVGRGIGTNIQAVKFDFLF